MASETVRIRFSTSLTFFFKIQNHDFTFFESSHTFFRTLMKIERSLALFDFFGA